MPLQDGEAGRIKLAIAMMTVIVEEAGADFVYTKKPTPGLRDKGGDPGTCMYVYEDEPDCLIGRVLHRLWATLDQLRDKEGYAARLLSDLCGGENVAMVLDAAQIVQDAGRTWGEALHAAKVYATKLGVEV